MASKRERDAKEKYIKTMLASFAGVIVGYFILDYISAIERIPLGQVFYIILGCVIIAVSGIFIFLAIKTRYFPKKRRKKRSAPIFLEDQKKAGKK